MLSLVSGCNLVAVIAHLFVLYLDCGWIFSCSEGQFSDTGLQGRTGISQRGQGVSDFLRVYVLPNIS